MVYKFVDTTISRAVVLNVSQQVATCHFPDLGLRENVSFDAAGFVPEPGSSGWADLICKVDKNEQREGLLAKWPSGNVEEF